MEKVGKNREGFLSPSLLMLMSCQKNFSSSQNFVFGECEPPLTVTGTRVTRQSVVLHDGGELDEITARKTFSYFEILNRIKQAIT